MSEYKANDLMEDAVRAVRAVGIDRPYEEHVRAAAELLARPGVPKWLTYTWTADRLAKVAVKKSAAGTKDRYAEIQGAARQKGLTVHHSVTPEAIALADSMHNKFFPGKSFPLTDGKACWDLDLADAARKEILAAHPDARAVPGNLGPEGARLATLHVETDLATVVCRQYTVLARCKGTVVIRSDVDRVSDPVEGPYTIYSS